MEAWERAKEYLEDRFAREPVIEGTPESIARQSGFNAHDIETALASLIGDGTVRPFQDDEGRLEYQWGDSCDVT